MNRVPTRLALVLATVLVLASAPVRAQTAVPDPTSVQQGGQTVVTFAFPASPSIVSFANQTVGGGDAFFLVGQPGGPTPSLTFLVTMTPAAPSPAPFSIDITTALGTTTWTGSLVVNPPNPTFAYTHVGPVVPPSGIVLASTSSVAVSGFASPYNVNQNLVCRVFNPVLNAEVVLTSTAEPMNNRTVFTGTVPVAPGMQPFFEVITDENCANCDGAVFAYSVSFGVGPTSPSLSVQYPAGIVGPFQCAPVFRET